MTYLMTAAVFILVLLGTCKLVDMGFELREKNAMRKLRVGQQYKDGRGGVWEITDLCDYTNAAYAQLVQLRGEPIKGSGFICMASYAAKSLGAPIIKAEAH